MKKKNWRKAVLEIHPREFRAVCSREAVIDLFAQVNSCTAIAIGGTHNSGTAQHCIYSTWLAKRKLQTVSFADAAVGDRFTNMSALPSPERQSCRQR